MGLLQGRRTLSSAEVVLRTGVRTGSSRACLKRPATALWKKKALYIPTSPHEGTLDDYCSPRRSRSSLWHQPYALTSQFSSRPI